MCIRDRIALCQFIRDGHLSSQIRKARKLYMNKSRALCEAARCVFEDHARVEAVSYTHLDRPVAYRGDLSLPQTYAAPLGRLPALGNVRRARHPHPLPARPDVYKRQI